VTVAFHPASKLVRTLDAKCINGWIRRAAENPESTVQSSQSRSYYLLFGISLRQLTGSRKVHPEWKLSAKAKSRSNKVGKETRLAMERAKSIICFQANAIKSWWAGVAGNL